MNPHAYRQFDSCRLFISDLADGGAAHFAETVREIKKRYAMTDVLNHPMRVLMQQR